MGAFFAEIGDSVGFGIKQTPNGRQSLFWTVIDAVDNKKMLLCNNIVTEEVFTHSSEKTNWAESDLRYYMNTYFPYSVFTKEEYNLILETTIENLDGQSTNDKIFSLSVSEYQKYLSDEFSVLRKAAWIENPGLSGSPYFSSNDLSGSWWLRTGCDMGNYTFGVNYVDPSGLTQKCWGSQFYIGFRPAIWIDESKYRLACFEEPVDSIKDWAHLDMYKNAINKDYEEDLSKEDFDAAIMQRLCIKCGRDPIKFMKRMWG